MTQLGPLCPPHLKAFRGWAPGKEKAGGLGENNPDLKMTKQRTRGVLGCGGCVGAGSENKLLKLRRNKASHPARSNTRQQDSRGVPGPSAEGTSRPRVCVPALRGHAAPGGLQGCSRGGSFYLSSLKMPRGKAFGRALRATSLLFSSTGFARMFVAQDLRNLLQGSEVRGQLNPLFLLQLLFSHHLLVLVSPQLPGAVLEGEGLSSCRMHINKW